MAHGQDHLADVLGLRLFLVLEDDHADLGDTVHDVGHVFAELVVDLFDGGAGVFHRIVQQARRHRGLVKAHALFAAQCFAADLQKDTLIFQCHNNIHHLYQIWPRCAPPVLSPVYFTIKLLECEA